MSAHQLAPLPVVILLLTAAAIAMIGFAPRRVHDVLATAAAAASAVICAVLLGHAGHAPIVEWLGGWKPHHDVALGIGLTADQLGTGAALLVTVLLTATLVYSWKYFDQLHGLVHALMLVLGAGLVAICITGDLFTMIVFYVLTTVCAVALTAAENEHRGPLQGAINFAVVNTIAGFGLLFGAALVYGHTGALNLAQIALSLDRHPADALVAVSFALLVLGPLTKAGIAPFHFWLPDAHAVAPSPVSALLSGAMATTMLLGAARLLSTAFGPVLQPHAGGVRAVLVGVGAVTALATAIACFEQRHVKRLFAFATASQIGVMLCGVGLQRDPALAGAALSAIGFGFTIAALFGAGGVLIRRWSSADEFELAGRGRDLPLTAITFAAAGLAFASLPPGAGFRGRWLIDEAARAAGYGWLPPVLALSSALVAAAVLRAGARIFLGWGTDKPADKRVEAEDSAQQQMSSEEEGDLATSPRPSLVLPVVSLALVGTPFVLGAIPGFSGSVEAAAAHFRAPGPYVALVLRGRAPHYAAVAHAHLGAGAWLYAAALVVGALAFAWLGLAGKRLFPVQLVDALRAAHSGHVGDYVAWWTFGMTVIGGLVLWAVAG